MHDFPNGGWMLYSSDPVRRNKGSAGGAVTELTRYLIEKGVVRTALSFSYKKESACFTPKWVYSVEKVVSIGSIYHEIQLVRFLRQTLEEVRPPLLIVALPCQVMAVRAICEKAGILVFVISLVCSGQLMLDATRELFRRVTNSREIVKYQYRGGGWPSGVRISYSDGGELFLENNHSIWSDIFHSGMFNLPGCFKCRDTFGIGADMTVGDPWLPRYVKSETEGVSMCIPHTQWAVSIIKDILDCGRLEIKEVVPSQEVLESQKGTLEKKALYLAHPRCISLLRSLYRQPFYKKWIFSKNISVHLRFNRKCMQLLRKF
jgi:coenzyme F420-reducing hydrogenase beta subunit